MPALLCYSRRGLAILLAVAVMLLAGCSGNNADPAGALDPAMPGQGVADNAPVAGGPDGGFPTGLPVDAYVDPAVIAARRGNALGEYRLNGADYQLASANTSIDAGKLTLDAREDQLSWAMYCFEENTEADAPFVFALELAQYIHAPIEIGIADYQSGAWHWVGMDRPGPVNYFGTPGNLEPVNPGGNLYVMVIAKAGGYAVVDGLTIYRESAVPPPVGLATGHDGIHPDRITLSWEDLSVTYPGLSYSEVVVERLIEGGEWTEITRVPSGTSTYEDIASEQNDLQFGEECSYRLRTVTAGETGVACPAEPGICQLRSVSHLSATSNTYPDLIRLLWDPVDGADGYQIEIQYEDEWRTLVELESGDADIYEHAPGGIPGLDPVFATEYEYRIHATWHEHLSPEFASATGSRGLAQVVSMTASNGKYPDKVSLMWNSVKHATGYHIGYREGSGEIELLDTSSGWDNNQYHHTHTSPPGKECAYDVEYTYYASAEYNGEVMPWDETESATGYRAVETPDLIWASDGEFGEFIRCRWSPQYGSDAMRVYRDGTGPEHLVAELGYARDWDDYVGDLEEHTYYIQSGWQGIWSELSEPDSGYRNLFLKHRMGEYGCLQVDLEEVDGRPAIALTRYGIGAKFFHSGVPEPASEDDWSGHTAITSSEECFVSMSVVDGLPAMAVSGAFADDDGVRYARATTPTPTGAGDWVAHGISSGEDVHGFTSLAVIDGLPALCFPGPDYKYARATSPTPSAIADWTVCDLPGEYEWPTLIEHQGRPALLAYTPFDGLDWVHLLTAQTANPTLADDWEWHEINAGNVACAATVANGFLTIGFTDWDGMFRYGQATSLFPETRFDWRQHHLGREGSGYCFCFEAIVEYAGRPVICFNSGRKLMLARATTADPQDWSDWLLDEICSDVYGGYDLEVIGGKLTVAFIDNQYVYYGIAQE